jgi:hypothetical protein
MVLQIYTIIHTLISLAAIFTGLVAIDPRFKKLVESFREITYAMALM